MSVGRDPHIPLSSSVRCFEAAARLGSHQAAAEELGRTPSAISHQVRILEAALGAPLFRKVGRNLVLTPQGVVYAAAVTRAIGELSRAHEQLADERPADTLRLSVGPGFAMLYALPNLSRFEEENPGLSLSLRVDVRRIDIKNSTVDAAIRVAHTAAPGLASTLIMQNDLRPVAREEVWNSSGRPPSAAELARLPLVGYVGAERAWDSWFSTFAPGVPAPPPSLVCDSVAAALQVAEAGAGVVLAPFPLVGAHLDAGRLSSPFSEGLPGLGDYHLVYRRSEAGSVRIRRLLAWLAPAGA